jgi:hypothetical protein
MNDKLHQQIKVLPLRHESKVQFGVVFYDLNSTLNHMVKTLHKDYLLNYSLNLVSTTQSIQQGKLLLDQFGLHMTSFTKALKNLDVQS